MEIKNISGNVITIIVDYSWNSQYGKGDDIGIATLEWTGSSYKVLKFKTGGMTYKAAERTAAEAQTAATQRRAQERALWNTIKDSNRASDYQVYLQQYPNGTYAALARMRMAEAERRTAEEAKRKAAEETARKEAERKAQQETQTALLTPPPEASVPKSFDGDWVLEIMEPKYMSNGVRVKTTIADSKFSVRFESSTAFSGRISGEIDANSPLTKSALTRFHVTAQHNAAKAVSPSSETMRTN